MAAPGSTDSLSGFAEANGLAFSETADLPAQGSTLTRADGRVEGAATGTLPGGGKGTLAHYTYSYTITDADHNSHTEHRRLTLVVTAIPVSIGFVPYLGFSGRASALLGTAGGTRMRRVDLGRPELKHANALIFVGTDENWQAQLFSPALLDWLARSPEDFGFELADGVLVAGRSNYLDAGDELRALCEDTSHLAAVISEEAQEAIDAGGAATHAARDPDGVDPKMERALKRVESVPLEHLGEAEPAFRRESRGSAGTVLCAARKAFLLTLLINIPGAALPISFILEGFYLALAVIEALIFLVPFYFFFRSAVRGDGHRFADEAFFRGYASSRGLALEEPLHFMAVHAEAGLPFKPDRVMTGPLPGGGEGALVLVGDGSKRADRIAVIGGPAGPLAEAELEAEAPGLSSGDLDTYFDQLAGELRAAQGRPGGGVATAPA